MIEVRVLAAADIEALERVAIDDGRRLGCTECWVLTEDTNKAANGLYSALGGARADDPVLYSWRLDAGED